MTTRVQKMTMSIMTQATGCLGVSLGCGPGTTQMLWVAYFWLEDGCPWIPVGSRFSLAAVPCQVSSQCATLFVAHINNVSGRYL